MVMMATGDYTQVVVQHDANVVFETEETGRRILTMHRRPVHYFHRQQGYPLSPELQELIEAEDVEEIHLYESKGAEFNRFLVEQLDDLPTIRFKGENIILMDEAAQ